MVDFLVVDFMGLFELDLVDALAVVVVRLVVGFAVAVDLLAILGADFAAADFPASRVTLPASRPFGAGSVAIASIRGAGFFGIAART